MYMICINEFIYINWFICEVIYLDLGVMYIQADKLVYILEFMYFSGFIKLMILSKLGLEVSLELFLKTSLTSKGIVLGEAV